MQRRLITVILFAVVAALASSTVVYRFIAANSAHASAVPSTQIYVAVRDLSAGAQIAESDLRLVKWPGTVNPSWVLRREDLLGRGLAAPINNGEPFPENRLTAKGAGGGIASGIPEGMRVVPVHIDEQSGLSHLVAPGLHVDVLSTESGGLLSGSRTITHTILQNVKVLSLDEIFDKKEKDKPPVVQAANLLVTPEQAEILSQAMVQDKIQLVLRNPLDETSISDAPLKPEKAAAPKTARSIFERLADRGEPLPTAPAPARKAEPTAEPPKPSGPTVEILQGTKRTVTVVAPAGSQPNGSQAGQVTAQGVSQ